MTFFILKTGRRACGIDWDSLYSLAFVCAREYSLFLCARVDICLCASAFCIFARVFNGGSSFTLMKTILYGRNIGVCYFN